MWRKQGPQRAQNYHREPQASGEFLSFQPLKGGQGVSNPTANPNTKLIHWLFFFNHWLPLGLCGKCEGWRVWDHKTPRFPGLHNRTLEGDSWRGRGLLRRAAALSHPRHLPSSPRVSSPGFLLPHLTPTLATNRCHTPCSPLFVCLSTAGTDQRSPWEFH